MTLFSRQTVIVTAGILIGLLVGLCGKQLIYRSINDKQRQQSNSGDVTAFSSGLDVNIEDVGMTVRRVPRRMQLQRKLKDSGKQLVVDNSGNGDATTVQGAVDAVEDGNTEPVTIYIPAGTYNDKVIVPANKPYITFQGDGLDKSVITWNDNANVTKSTYKTASMDVEADYFIARNISFQNTAPRPEAGEEGGQAIALQVMGDKSAFYGCGIYGYQDTLNDHQGRHLFTECHIEGAIDFIFGNARSLYQRCTIKSNANNWGAITAHSRQSEHEVTGYSFVDCSVVGTGQIYLGRAWRSYARVVIASTYMDDIIDSRGWDDWDNTSADMTVYYGEYGNSGPGSNMAERVSYTRALSSKEAAQFTGIDWIDGSDWL